MDFKKLPNFFVFIVSLWVSAYGRIDIPGEQILTHLFDIYDSYNKHARPVRSYEQSAQVTHQLSLRRIISLENNVLTADAWQHMVWADPRLVWDPEDFKPWGRGQGEAEVNIPDNLIWTPDILLYDNAALCNEKNCLGIHAIVRHNGNIHWMPATRVTAYCSVVTPEEVNDVIHHGDIKCPLKFGSWTYDIKKMNITNHDSRILMGDFVPNPQLQVVHTVAERQEVRYECCPEPFAAAIYTVYVRRAGLTTPVADKHVSNPIQGDEAPASDDVNSTEHPETEGDDVKDTGVASEHTEPSEDVNEEKETTSVETDDNEETVTTTSKDTEDTTESTESEVDTASVTTNENNDEQTTSPNSVTESEQTSEADVNNEHVGEEATRQLNESEDMDNEEHSEEDHETHKRSVRPVVW